MIYNRAHLSSKPNRVAKTPPGIFSLTENTKNSVLHDFFSLISKVCFPFFTEEERLFGEDFHGNAP